MRKGIQITAVIALVAGALIIGVTQSDKIKAAFASKNVYSQEIQQQQAQAQTALDNAAQTSAALTQTEASIGQTQQNTVTTDEQTAQPTTPATEATGGMTPVDLSNTNLNEQTPAAGTDATTTTSATTETTTTTTTAPASTEAPTGEPATPAANVPADLKLTYKFDVQKALENRSIGSASAPLTVDDYSSLTCPHCAHFHNEILPKIKENYIDKGKVRWVFHSFPLNEPALKADMVARCAPNDQYLKLIDFMFQNQERWAFTDQPLANLNMLLKIGGITDDIFYSCISNKELELGIVQAAQQANEKQKIEATPSFVLNTGKKFSGAGSYEGFAYDLDAALKQIAAPQASTPATPADKK